VDDHYTNQERTARDEIAHTDPGSDARRVLRRTDGRARAASERSDEAQARAERFTGWRRRFLTARRLDERLRLLAAFGLHDDDVVKVVRTAKVRSIRRWRTERPPATRLAERWEPIDDLCAVIGYFLADETYDEEGIVAWLRSRQGQLDYQRPLDVLGAGDFDAVRAAVEYELDLIDAREQELIPVAHEPSAQLPADPSGVR
jgi:hypothetical protein